MKKLLALSLVLLTVAPFAFAGSTSPPRSRLKTLTDATTTSYATVSIQSGTYTSGIVHWVVEAGDGTDFQTLAGATYFAAVNKGGTVTCAVGDIGTTINAVSTGTLTATSSCAAGTKLLTLKTNADSSLTPTVIRIRYVIEVNGPSTVNGL